MERCYYRVSVVKIMIIIFVIVLIDLNVCTIQLLLVSYFYWLFPSSFVSKLCMPGISSTVSKSVKLQLLLSNNS